jgi:TonB family protein
MVRALIGKDGKIKDAFVTQGNTMLNDAAITAAKTAIFKPALSQHRPVEVWVQIPIRFSLN